MSRPTGTYSLRRRLLAWLLTPLIVIGLVALLDSYREADRTADAVSDRVLAGSALAIAERIVVGENGRLEVDVPYVALEMLTSAAQDRVFYRVDGPPGTFITGYQNLPTVGAPPGEATTFSDAAFQGEPIRVAALARSASTGTRSIPYVVTVAETTIARAQLTRTILVRSGIRLGVLIACAAALVWVAVSMSLRPLYRMRDAIAERSPDDLQPIDQDVPSEVLGLVETVNSFMARLGAALAAMRNFTGNASHQLRTPMAIVRTQLALAARAPTVEAARQAAATGDEAVAHAERVLSQLLLLARIDTADSERIAAFETVDLTALARERTVEHFMRARDEKVDLGFAGDEACLIQGDRLLLGELIDNLVSNAVTYAGAGAEATVGVHGAGEIVLTVEDDGPGLSADERERVLERFARSSSKAGAGLGLPIVEEIAQLFGGRLELAQGRGGRGLKVSVCFPASAAT